MRLSWNDMLTIEKMLKQGYKAPAIARKIGAATRPFTTKSSAARLKSWIVSYAL